MNLRRTAGGDARRSNAPRRRSTRSTSIPTPVNIDRVRILHVPWLFRLPWFRRFHGYEMGPLILLKHPLAQYSARA